MKLKNILLSSLFLLTGCTENQSSIQTWSEYPRYQIIDPIFVNHTFKDSDDMMIITARDGLTSCGNLPEFVYPNKDEQKTFYKELFELIYDAKFYVTSCAAGLEFGSIKVNFDDEGSSGGIFYLVMEGKYYTNVTAPDDYINGYGEEYETYPCIIISQVIQEGADKEELFFNVPNVEYPIHIAKRWHMLNCYLEPSDGPKLQALIDKVNTFINEAEERYNIPYDDYPTFLKKH